ncbi:MAG: hypothetical protein H7240_03625 [Glaciimonas sp.]|nr:hypothetical protein [Glaciimonas sp.]
MNHLDILIPFGLPPAELTRDIMRELRLPALANLVARVKTGSRQGYILDEFARALPHEAWLTQSFGLENHIHILEIHPESQHSSPPVALAVMRAFGLTVNEGHWFILHPAHIHIARDHLVLTDIRQVTLSEANSRALFDEAKPFFEEDNRILLYGDANTWFVRANDWQQLQTSTPDAACGHNIDIWMPYGEGARAWCKLQNKVQMQWFENTLNQQRAATSMQAINALWLWGGGSPGINLVSAPVNYSYSHAFNLYGWARIFGQLTAHKISINGNAEKLIATPGAHGFLLLDDLIAPALTGEWSEWIQQLQAIERDWFAPLLHALQSGKLKQLKLIFTGNTQITELTTTPLSLKKFWIKPSLVKLIRETMKSTLAEERKEPTK